MKYIMIASLALMLFWMFKYFLLKKKNRKVVETVLTSLDWAIAGNEFDVSYNESAKSALEEKLNKLITISKEKSEGAYKERNLVKALISDISHQVNTPLTNIILYTGFLKEKLLLDSNKEMATKVYTQSEKLSFFMKELVRASYLETDMIVIHKREVPIASIIKESCQEVEIKALKKEILLDIEESNRNIVLDSKWTKEAISNVLDNGIKYSPKKSTIRITTINYNRFLCIKIEDKGIGISKEEQRMIFKRFYRSPSVSESSGIGVGLYLVREIIEKQKGYVKVESTLGKGTTFFIFLPWDNV